MSSLMSFLSEPEARALLQAARLATENAYAPYSKFPVGAALLTFHSETIIGVNVENVSYGLTLCAERSALATAISQGKRDFRAIAIWAACHPQGAIMPCGACRQVLAEFLSPMASVIVNSEEGPRILTMASLLPEAFSFEFGQDDNCQGKDNSKPDG